MRLRHVLSAAIAGIGLGGSFAHATLSVSLVPVNAPYSSAALAADPSLSGDRTYNLQVTQTGEQFQVADIKIQLAGGTSGSFYTAGTGAAAAYNTQVSTPSGSTTILGDSDYPSQTETANGSGLYPATISSSAFDVSWGQYNFTAQANGTYTIAQITLTGNAGGYITGYVAGTGSANADLIQNTPSSTVTVPAGVIYVPLLGDNSGDGVVGLADFNNVENNFGASGANVVGDTNGDGIVGLADFNNVENNFGSSMPAYGSPTDGSVPEASLGAIVPEPTSLGLIGLALSGLVSRRRK